MENVQKIQIAIRLSNGQRLEETFLSSNTIDDIIQYLVEKKISLPDQFFLSTAEIPKREFHQTHLTLEQANIQNKTLFHIDR